MEIIIINYLLDSNVILTLSNYGWFNDITVEEREADNNLES